MLDFPQADVTIGYRGGPVVLEHPLAGLSATLPAVEEVYSYRPESPYRQLWRGAAIVADVVAFLADGFSLVDPTPLADSISLSLHGWLGHTEAASAAAVSLGLPAFAGVWARPGARAVADLVSGVPDLAGAAVRPTGAIARQFDALGVPAARGIVPSDVVVASGESFRAPSKGIGEPVLFGQRRVSPTFRVDDAFPATSGRSLADVAADLRSGILSPDDLPLTAFRHPDTGALVSMNTRTRAVLAEVGLEPTKVSIVDLASLSARQRQQYLGRLREDLLIDSPLPGPRVPVTPSASDLRIMSRPDGTPYIISLPGRGS